MRVKLNKSFFVKPAEVTQTGRLPLTEYDQIDSLTHTLFIYFYRPLSNNWFEPKDVIINTLKESLSRVLVHFYPLAGRLCWIGWGHLELECNDKGVELIEAEAEAKLSDLGDFTPSSEFVHLCPKFDYRVPIEEIPVASVQVTKFQCGGMSLGVAISHGVVDGQSYFGFISEWARLARGEPLGAVPILDRRLLRAGELPNPTTLPHQLYHPPSPPPLIIGQTSCENERNQETIISMLKLTKTQIDMLKNKAKKNRSTVGHNSRAYTRFEAIAAHIWRCTCKARKHGYPQQTQFYIPVDVRERMQPPLPQKFFGNAITFATATGISGDIVSKPLGYTARIIRQEIDKVTSEYVHSEIDFLKNLEDLSPLQDIHALQTDESPFYGNPNLEVSSLINLPLYGMDFGWGNEISLATVSVGDFDGSAMILPCHDENEAVVVAICLQVTHMNAFKKLFYEEIIMESRL